LSGKAGSPHNYTADTFNPIAVALYLPVSIVKNRPFFASMTHLTCKSPGLVVVVANFDRDANER